MICHGCDALLPPSRGSKPRKWCSERCRRASYGDPCVNCGARTSFGATKTRVPEPRCTRCAAERRVAPQRALIERLWAEGRTSREIAAQVGWTGRRPATVVSNLRTRGYNLPYRRTPEQVARIAAGAEERLAKARAVYRQQKQAA